MQTDLLQNMYTFPCTSGRRGGLIDVHFIIVRAYCHHYRVLQKKKDSQKNPKPYPKKVLINTNNNKENSHQKPSDQSFFFHQILTRDKTSKHRIKQLQCKWEGLLI